MQICTAYVTMFYICYIYEQPYFISAVHPNEQTLFCSELKICHHGHTFVDKNIQ